MENVPSESSGSPSSGRHGGWGEEADVEDESRAMDPLAPQVLVRPYKPLRKPSNCVGTACSNAGPAPGQGARGGGGGKAGVCRHLAELMCSASCAQTRHCPGLCVGRVLLKVRGRRFCKGRALQGRGLRACQPGAASDSCVGAKVLDIPMSRRYFLFIAGLM